MFPPAPIRIVDIYLDRSPPAPAAGAEHCLVRFWSNDWLVGQTFDSGAAERILPVKELARCAVQADVLADARASAARDQSGTVALDASIIICTRDRPEALARCLASLPEQTARAREVIVVDNASRNERTREAALAAGVIYVREDRPGLDIARNTGARKAQGQFLVYTDDDVVLHPLWLERMVRAFEDEPEVMAVTGLVLPGELETDAQRLFEGYWSFMKGLRRIEFGAEFYARDRFEGCPAWEVGAGASMAFRRDVFQTVGGFDERLDVGAAGCSGDSEYWHRVLANGLQCRYEPGAVAFHFHRRDIAGLSSQIFHYMRGHSAALLVQFERTRNWGNLLRLIGFLPTWYLYRFARRLVGKGGEEDRFLTEEFRGFLSGIGFYLRRRRVHSPLEEPQAFQ